MATPATTGEPAWTIASGGRSSLRVQPRRVTHDLLEEAVRDPGLGVGKPERLSGDLSGCWSRHIDQEHRVVYTFADGELVVVSARYHH